MWIDIALLVIGLGMILVGSELLTDGASALAKKMKVSDLVIGLTIVAFGTSAPELVISVVSSVEGNAGIAIGNVLGSNVFNILMIVGCTAIVAPISVGVGTMRNEIPLVILSALALFIAANGVMLDGAASNEISRVSGLLLLCFFAIFMAYTFAIAHKPQPDGGGEQPQAVKQMPLWRSLAYIVLGLAGLIFGGDWFVDGASGLARALHVSDAVIGLTIVAVGTSLPELATSIAAALKHNPGLAIGNVIGSCLFNVFFILGVAATVRPLPVQGIGMLDFLMYIGSALLLWLFGMVIGQRVIKRSEGIVMLVLYIAYTAYLVANA